ncbi:MAG: carotenoid biosynthesis protein [Candidatus Acidiferrum sp.]
MQREIAEKAWTLWGLIGAYVGADVLFLLAGLYPGHVPVVVSVALHILPPLAFALVHGARIYGWRGVLAFAGLYVVVGNVLENLSIATGFPFGHYVFTERMGPKILQVPILLGLAYVGMGYLSWTVARAILQERVGELSGWRVAALPVLASVVMTAWDLAMDPIWSTVGRLWIWQQGGGYFGVPSCNYVGWLVTNYVIYQSFVLVVMRGGSGIAQNRAESVPLSYWRMAVIFYALAGIGNLLLAVPTPRHPVVTDASGSAWRVSDITLACGVISVLVMGGFALCAWVRLGEEAREDERSVSG